MIVTLILVVEAPDEADEHVDGLYGLAKCIGNGTVNLVSAAVSGEDGVVDCKQEILNEIKRKIKRV
jgi:hypothetical protein